MDHDRARARFRLLHESGTFTMPNAYDEGSARLVADLGFEAVATTSSGHAATLGRRDMTVTRDELVAHAALLAGATALPLSVDAERCFPDDPGGVAGTVERLADAGAAGCSIEDWDPAARRIETHDVATARVAEAARAAASAGMVLTARAENLLRGVADLDDTIARLRAYRDAGAGCVYAPGLVDTSAIGRVVEEVATAVNVLLLRSGPSRDVLASLGVRRLSVGGWLAWVAYGEVARAAAHLRDQGTLDEEAPVLGREVVERAFAAPPPAT